MNYFRLCSCYYRMWHSSDCILIGNTLGDNGYGQVTHATNRDRINLHSRIGSTILSCDNSLLDQLAILLLIDLYEQECDHTYSITIELWRWGVFSKS